MDASVIVPTRGRPAKIAACVAAFARQTPNAPAFEVLVGFDGEDDATASATRQSWRTAGGADDRLKIDQFPHRGYTPARNDLLKSARGRVMISANDDIVPSPGFIAAHVREHTLAAARGKTVIVSGASPFVVHQDDTLLDRLMRETSMVFFHDVMARYGEPDAATKDWGFRHCYGLNFSAPMGQVRELGGFAILPSIYGYEDIECAFRIHRRFGSPVLFRPDALALHDHRFGAREYASREYKLGYAALGFSRMCPHCARETFGRDITTNEERLYSQSFVQREQGGASRAWRTFQELERTPANAIAGPHVDLLRESVYQQHLPMKRWLWRHGLQDAFGGRAMEPDVALQELA
jgi:glycosyltransferase involved in cell wall biosynthesis